MNFSCSFSGDFLRLVFCFDGSGLDLDSSPSAVFLLYSRIIYRYLSTNLIALFLQLKSLLVLATVLNLCKKRCSEASRFKVGSSLSYLNLDVSEIVS